MSNDFGVERTLEGIALERINVEDLSLASEKGLCMADAGDPTRPRDVEWYDQNVLVPGMGAGKIGDGVKTKFDDRKMRLHSTSIRNGNLVMAFGLSYFGEFKTTMGRTDEENLALQERGERELGERYAFLPRNPGVAAIVITSEGSIFLGERISPDDSGKLNAVAGHLQFRQDPSKVDLTEDVYRELKEEFGIDKEAVCSLELVGGYNHAARGDMDFAFLAKSDVPNDYFSSGAWKARVNEREHKGLVQLSNFGDVQRLLSTGMAGSRAKPYDLMYSTRGALQGIRPSEMR